MRAAAPLQITLCRFGAWRAMLWTWCAIGVAAMAGWAGTHERPLPWWIPVVAVVVALALVASAHALADIPGPLTLRWDGKTWNLQPPGHDAIAGSLSVAIDLGPWMLLRFVPDWPVARQRPCWLPLQSRGLEPVWHALRCTLHAPPTHDSGAAAAVAHLRG